MVAGSFAAGFLATLAFHQTVLGLLHQVGLTDRIPFGLERMPPLGIPGVISLAFWGGVWSIALAYAERLLAGRINYLVFSLLFGAIAPSLVSWFVSAPLHGLPVGGGWPLSGVATTILVNAAWGVGTALLLPLWFRRQGRGEWL